MRHSLTAAALLAATFSPLSSFAAEPNHSWDTLTRRIKTGNKIEITRMNSGEVDGKLVAIDDQSITVRQSGTNHKLAREDVFRVRYATRGRHAAWGAIAGAAVGAALLTAIDLGSKQPHADEAVGIGLLLGAGAGAIGGGVLPIGPALYQAAEMVRRKP